MKTALLSLTLLFALNAKADIIKCSFTEPFYNLELNSDAKTLTMIAPDEDGEITRTVLSTNMEIKKLESRVVTPVVEVPKYEVTADGEQVMILDLDYQGSDGMSDYVFPYSTKHGNNYGGCESDIVKKLNANYED